MTDKHRVCPVEVAHHLDNRFRRLIQNPKKILRPYIREGMTVIDLGCWPGFFSVDMAVMVGNSGKVIASDLQEGMLLKLKAKIQSTELEDRIILHQCEEDKIGWTEPVDFVLAFYMVHEVPDQENFFNELSSIVNIGGRVFIVEPPFHVSKTEFEEIINKAVNAGFVEVERPVVLMSSSNSPTCFRLIKSHLKNFFTPYFSYIDLFWHKSLDIPSFTLILSFHLFFSY